MAALWVRTGPTESPGVARRERAQLPEPGAESPCSRPTVQVGTQRGGGRGGACLRPNLQGLLAGSEPTRNSREKPAAAAGNWRGQGSWGKRVSTVVDGAQLGSRLGKKVAGGIWERSLFSPPKPNLCITVGTTGPGEEEVPSRCHHVSLNFPPCHSLQSPGSRPGGKGDSPHTLLTDTSNKPPEKE